MKKTSYTKNAILNIFTIVFFLTLFTPLSLTIYEQAFAIEKMTEEELNAAITKLLHDKPEILFSVMEEHSVQFIKTITIASEKNRTETLKAQWKKDLQVPKSFDLKNRPIAGNNKAKNTIISYSDFLCTYCAQAAQTTQNLMDKRDDIQFIFKSIPASDAGRTAAIWFYHMNQEHKDKAWQFHDTLFANQRALAADPIGTMKEVLTQLGLDANKIEKAILTNQKQLEGFIKVDEAEAESMGIKGTPYFIVNNVKLRGAQPIKTFEDAIIFTNNNK